MTRALARKLARPDQRSPRRQRLVKKLYACGPRPVMEALIQAAASSPGQLDSIIQAFTEIPPEVYRSVGASELPIDALRDRLSVIKGGRT
jgi:hypothetical protein